MPKQYWMENDPDPDLDPIGSLLSEWSDPEGEEEAFRSDFFQGLSGRRQKAAFLLMVVWGATVTLHFVAWGTWVVMGLAGLLAFQGFRLIGAQPEDLPEPLTAEELAEAPTVSLLVAAKNEEAVIGQLVSLLCNLDYPADKYEVWAIDDRSTDRTPEILNELAGQYPQLKVIHRPAGAGGGKSGALNQVLPLTRGEIVGVFDADARVTPDLLKQVLPLFQQPEVGAVQTRKAIANGATNFWTKGQAAEMALDSYFQQQRTALGGLGELRGNGQFVRRLALERCGGWNEQTITDDLDLTIRLHLDNWKVGFLLQPAVAEEGVTGVLSLWHQRNRWAEGGYQRYLDYWRLLLNQRLGVEKKFDVLSFLLMQYLLPTAAIPDLGMAIASHQLPLLSPVTSVALSMSCWAMFAGLRRTRQGERLGIPDLLALGWQTLRGSLYLLHWFAIIPSITLRMSVRPKRLKWVKTTHQGREAGAAIAD